MAFADKQRNIQHTHQVIHREVYPFEHRLFFHALAEKFVPSPLLSVQIRFKLPTAFAAQFEQHAHFFQRRGQHHHVTNPVSARVAVHSTRLLHQIFHFQPKNIFDDMLHIHCWKADTHIVEQQCQRLRVQPNERVFQPLAYLLRHGLVFLLQPAVILCCQSGFKSHILFGYADLHPFYPKVRYPSPVLQFNLRFLLILFKVLRSSPILSDLYPPVRERGFRRSGAADAAPNAPFRAVGFRAARRRADGARA